MKKILENETHLKLIRSEIDKAVANLVSELNLYGGSNGSIKLYKLVAYYLLIPKIRKELNQVINKLPWAP